MDNFERFLTIQQRWMSLVLWKTNIIPGGRRYWEERYNLHCSQLSQKTQGGED